MLALVGDGVAGKRKTTIMKTIHVTAIAATGMLCKDGLTMVRRGGVKDLPIFRVRMARA